MIMSNIYIKIDIEEIYLNELNGKNDWRKLSKNYDLSEEILDEFGDKIFWHTYTVHHHNRIDRRMFKKYKGDLDWDYISMWHELNNEFIEEFKYQLDWKVLYEFRLPKGYSIMF